MKRFTCSQVVATVFALGWATCPMVFAAERGKQEGKRVAREIVSRLVEVEQADSLLDQITAMNIGNYIVGDVISLERPEGTYIFDQVIRNAVGGVSGIVTEYNLDGERVADYNIANVAIPDDNRINFSISVSTPNMDWVEDGALVGLQSDPGKAVALVSVDGGDSRLSLVDFSGLAVSGSQAVAPSLITVTQFPDSQGGVAAIGVVVVVVCVLFIAVTCLIFGWWGCDGSFWWRD